MELHDEMNGLEKLLAKMIKQGNRE